ncbi:MAG: hypothetical protein HYY48_04730 [Gammaproteobacteria bacterium]|nr:hypothetical protein [Gammaproteobacteria bacterium]
METRKPHFGIFALAAILAFAAGVICFSAVPVPVQAAEKEQKIGVKVGKPLQAAQELTQQKKWKEALAKVNEANAISGKTAWEQFKIDQFLVYISLNLADYGSAAKAMEASIASGFLTAEEVTTHHKQLAQINYQSKNYAKAAEYGRKYLQASPGNTDMLLLVGQAYYLQKDFKNARDNVRALIQASDAAGKEVKEEYLQLLMSCDYELKDSDGVAKDLEMLVQRFPSVKYWRNRLEMVMDRSNLSEQQSLEIYRLMLATDVLESAEEYVEMAELALHLGLPGEAKSVLEKGFAANKLGGEQKDRQQRLLDMAKNQADGDSKSLSQLEKEAAAAASGEADAKLGEAYLTYGQYDPAISALQRGLGKSGVKNAEAAQLHLGLALLGAGKDEDARSAFKTVTADPALSDLARLWTIYSKQQN